MAGGTRNSKKSKIVAPATLSSQNVDNAEQHGTPGGKQSASPDDKHPLISKAPASKGAGKRTLVVDSRRKIIEAARTNGNSEGVPTGLNGNQAAGKEPRPEENKASGERRGGLWDSVWAQNLDKAANTQLVSVPGAVVLLLSIALGAWVSHTRQGLGALTGFRSVGTTLDGNSTRTLAPSRGVFPDGCKWRAVEHKGGKKKEFWAIVEYEYYDESRERWSSVQPAVCYVRGEGHTPQYEWPGGTPRTEVNCTETYCIYDKIWYNAGRFYLLVDGPHEVEKWSMTRNQDLNVLHVNNATEFANSVTARVVRGDSLIFDFIYFLHPTAIGHWSEMLFPLYSILRKETSFQRPVQQVVMLHLKRVHLMEWVRAVMAVAFGTAPGAALPPLIMQQEQPDIWRQPVTPLEGFAPHEWACFERALVVRDLFTGGVRTFFSTDDAQHFRESLYRQYDLAPPVPAPVPRTILFQRKRANRRIMNEDVFVDMLREFGEVRVVEFNETTSFRQQLEAITTSGIFISVHTSNLANSQFLRPGSAVFEIIQRNWAYHGLDKSFQIQTEVMGDIHHYAWRCLHRNQTIYIDKRDGARFGDWTHPQCETEDCIEAHTNVDVLVDVAQIRALLASRLPLVFAGLNVSDAQLPWP